ncbi:hypothetical protein CIW53_12820 [Rhodanobacter sp. T12-5]|nr:hypothetical protein CIW53_12820 [Rhodanobacter sp. T12-5]
MDPNGVGVTAEVGDAQYRLSIGFPRGIGHRVGQPALPIGQAAAKDAEAVDTHNFSNVPPTWCGGMVLSRVVGLPVVELG